MVVNIHVEFIKKNYIITTPTTDENLFYTCCLIYLFSGINEKFTFNVILLVSKSHLSQMGEKSLVTTFVVPKSRNHHNVGGYSHFYTKEDICLIVNKNT